MKIEDVIDLSLKQKIPNAPIGYIDLNIDCINKIPFPSVRKKMEKFIGWSVVVYAIPVVDQGLWVWSKVGSYRYLLANYILGQVGRTLINELEEMSVRAFDLTEIFGQRLSMVELGELAGIGKRGWNNLLLHPTYGPWLQIHALLFDSIEKHQTQLTEDVCIQCSLCIDACPAKAITQDDFVASRCSRLVASPGTGKSKAISLTPNSYIECAECLMVCPIGDNPTEIFEWKR